MKKKKPHLRPTFPYSCPTLKEKFEIYSPSHGRIEETRGPRDTLKYLEVVMESNVVGLRGAQQRKVTYDNRSRKETLCS